MIICQVKQKVKTWPYLEACTNEAEFVTRPSIRSELPKVIEYLCEFHAQCLKDAFGEYAAMPFEEAAE